MAASLSKPRAPLGAVYGDPRMASHAWDTVAEWQGNLFVSDMVESRVLGTGQLLRIVSNGEVCRESLPRDLPQRIRGVPRF